MLYLTRMIEAYREAILSAERLARQCREEAVLYPKHRESCLREAARHQARAVDYRISLLRDEEELRWLQTEDQSDAA